MKPKNKKILALLCLPVLVMTMIFPLCSFMPGVEDINGINGFYDYSPSYGLNVDVGVQVWLTGNTELQIFYGYVYDVLNCTVNYNEEEGDPYPYIARYSDYVSSAYASSLEFYVDDLAIQEIVTGVGFFIDYAVGLRPYHKFDEATEYNVATYLDGRFNVTYSDPSISDNYVTITCFDQNAGYAVDLSDFYLDGTIYYCALDDTENVVFYDKLEVNKDLLINYVNDDYEVMDTYTLATTILSDNVEVGHSFEIISFDFALLPPNYDNGDEFSDYVSSCVVAATIMPIEFARDQYLIYLSRISDIWFSDGYNSGYAYGYSTGYNKGVSDGPDTWKSLGSFLIDTVGAFFKFEIWNGFSLGTVMSIFVGAMLLIAFLKIFAGG